MAETLHGTVTKTFFNQANFTAGMLHTDDGDHVRFCGKIYAAEGDHLSASGRWKNDPKYGYQFEVHELEYELPQTREGLVNYLIKNPAFEGIGAKTAEKIVSAMADGEGLDEILRHRPEVLIDAGVSRRVVNTLAETWIANASENNIRMHLAGFGLTHHQMQTLLEKFGTSIVSMLKHDPYLLIKHLFGFGFTKVDKIALKMGIAKTHPGRIEAALSYCLSKQVNNGHTWTPVRDLISLANEVLIIDTLDSRDLIKAAGQRLLDRGDIVADSGAISLPGLHEDERLIQHTLLTYAWTTPDHEIDDDGGDDLGDDQREAYQTALTSGICVISGGAGTGKTYVVSRLTRTFIEAGLSVRLCAPTGKAAKRIEQLLAEHGVDQSASTIHRMLGYNGIEFRTAQVTADVVIVDEMSMVDVRLMAQLLRRIDFERTQLILVGDHNQLPPVGPGNVLRDIIQHHLAPTTIMTQVHRHAGVLKTNCVGVLKGKIAPSAFDDRSRWTLINKFRDAKIIKNYLRDLIFGHIPRRLGFDPIRDVQIITPQHRGILGTRSLNAMMQYLHFGHLGVDDFAVGDKVIQTRNDYTLNVMNGTIGYVTEISDDDVTIDFEGTGPVRVDHAKTKHIELAYALTAHKAQGSEFPCTVVVCHKSHYFADRNWLYTAVTRAAHTCVLIGDDYGLRHAAKQIRNTQRRTLLSLWSKRQAAESEELAA